MGFSRFLYLKRRGKKIIHNASLYDEKGERVWSGDFLDGMPEQLKGKGIFYILSEHAVSPEMRATPEYLKRWKIAMVVNGKFVKDDEEWKTNYMGPRR